MMLKAGQVATGGPALPRSEAWTPGILGRVPGPRGDITIVWSLNGPGACFLLHPEHLP